MMEAAEIKLKIVQSYMDAMTIKSLIGVDQDFAQETKTNALKSLVNPRMKIQISYSLNFVQIKMREFCTKDVKMELADLFLIIKHLVSYNQHVFLSKDVLLVNLTTVHQEIVLHLLKCVPGAHNVQKILVSIITIYFYSIPL